MKVLIIGSGGREHALGWKLSQSPTLPRLYFAPGNPGTAELGTNLKLSNHAEITAFAAEEGIHLVIVGPEQPLVDGLADKLNSIGVPCFGPDQAAARLEGSKTFAKEVMEATGVPTATYRAFEDLEEALAYAESQPHPLVVKADGLAGGKGVTICQDLAQTQAALQEAMADKRFGKAGDSVVIEEFLTGTEVSFHLISDGERFLPLISAQDHKTLYEDGKGPNTGGMGTYAPSPLVTPELADTIQNDVCIPVLNYLRDQGHPFRGVLFAGLMLTWNGPKVLEFNVRFGDPETQVIMPLLDFDLLPVLHEAARGKLDTSRPHGWRDDSAACVVLAAEGYPVSPRKGDTISGLAPAMDTKIFHAGTKRCQDGTLETAGGRVMGVTAWGEDLETARTKAYRQVEEVKFDGKHYRRDIGGSAR
ncbi:Phosphoribosylamine--glycine ligase [Sulfidibacter corallicola]|uniref:Phosphoribosylamine--glycine ligase n=1 Tax=Sulfidibacter corallicola TaxID=2818388 RepID=A0A8A4TFH0_SULCO|nr:phosphoribosylamine--glycine ligase [Sulfidibacter corallicola]QTD48696.1 phosphoribosylamine--glycine ligase [Sulfidibacter corallicola]